jgi:hypothetical protein
MFEEEFYPTPESIIEKMIEPYLARTIVFPKKSILEPSAGKGDIVDYISKRCNANQSKMYCIEQNGELQYILQSKNYKVIHNDFLTYSGNYYFDLIAMNPPFSNGDEHLLKAWDILKSGDIVCLLNAETIKNPFTKKRALLKSIIEKNGSVEYLGNCFSDAERKTDVEVALVRLKKESSESDSMFSGFGSNNKDKTDFNETTLENQVARQDVIENTVICYQNVLEAMKDAIKAVSKLKFYLDPFVQYDWLQDSVIKILTDSRKDKQILFNDAIDEIKGLAWNHVFLKTKFQQFMTSRIKDDFHKFASTQGAMEFNAENIESMFDMLFMNRGKILEDCVTDVFDYMTKYDKKNKIHWEGWKTNDAYKVNRKVIFPYAISFDDRFGGYSHFSLSYRSSSFSLHDIDKVMCFISGKKIDNIQTIQDSLSDSFKRARNVYKNSAFDNTAESTFFKMRYFKKGTLHLEFKDADLWERFNITAAKGKNWLPE